MSIIRYGTCINLPHVEKHERSVFDMQNNYLQLVSSVITLMKQPDSPRKNVDMHKVCYSSLFRYLFENDIPFSMETALEWLEDKEQDLTHETLSQYRNALFRLEHYILFGNIDSPLCRSDKDFFCRSGMSESFYRLTYELEDYFNTTQNPGYYHKYAVSIKAFFRLATEMEITEPEAITIDILIEYWGAYCIPMPSVVRRQNAVCAMTALMKYLNRRGDVPACYQLTLFGENAEKLLKMKIQQTGNVFQPSRDLEIKADEFLDALGEWKYLESSKVLYRSDFSWYFMFLEINHLSHSSDAVALCLNALPDYPCQKKPNWSVKARRSHTIRLFDNYLQGKMINSSLRQYTREADLLPEWSKTILSDFVESREQDGMAESTLTMCRTAGCSFFMYLDKNGIEGPAAITPDIIKSFHDQDVHSTPESRNAYGTKLRQLLCFIADKGLVPSTLSYAVSSSCAPHRSIVDVFSDEIVDKIYEYRDTASTPLELRNIAIVMLGLRMGIRGIDIINLQIRDFDWKAKTVSFVQQKTRKAITLPVPSDVGNSVYRYILKGRPQSADSGNGYIFVRNQAPYIPAKSSTVCRNALKNVLAAYGIELSPGQGFHMTRKTFATRMMRANNRIDDISNALGHARRETAEVYLERDEQGMKQCPLNFGGVLS